MKNKSELLQPHSCFESAVFSTHRAQQASVRTCHSLNLNVRQRPVCWRLGSQSLALLGGGSPSLSLHRQTVRWAVSFTTCSWHGVLPHTGTKGTRPGDHGLKTWAKINVFLINCLCQVSVTVTKAGNRLTRNAGSHKQVQIRMKTRNRVCWSDCCQDDKIPEENNLGEKKLIWGSWFHSFQSMVSQLPCSESKVRESTTAEENGRGKQFRTWQPGSRGRQGGAMGTRHNPKGTPPVTHPSNHTQSYHQLIHSS